MNGPTKREDWMSDEGWRSAQRAAIYTTLYTRMSARREFLVGLGVLFAVWVALSAFGWVVRAAVRLGQPFDSAIMEDLAATGVGLLWLNGLFGLFVSATIAVGAILVLMLVRDIGASAIATVRSWRGP